MFGSAVVDVGVALVYVFVLVSVLVSALNELVAGLLKQRAKALWRGIGGLLQSGSLRDAFYGHPLIKSLCPPLSGAMIASQSMTGPSYIPKQTFALALLDLLQQPYAKVREVERVLGEMALALRAGGQAPPAAFAAKLTSLATEMPNSAIGNAVRADLTSLTTMCAAAGAPVAQLLAAVEALQGVLPARLAASLHAAAAEHSSDLATVLRVLAEEAAGNVDRLRSAIEEWFDAGMNRVAGWYKRWTQLWQLGIGLVLAILLNINVVTIGIALWKDIPLRNAIVGEAEKFARNPPPGLWVTDSGKQEGDFNLYVTSVSSKDNDRVLVRVVLPKTVNEDTAVTVKAANDVIRLEKAQLVVPKGSTDGEVAGTVKDGLPVEANLEASYTSGDKKITKTAKRIVKIESDPGTRIAKTRELLNTAKLPIGWPQGSAFDWTMIPGWLLTAIGASFGAPFWFDLLNRIVQLRSGGPKPDEQKKGTSAGADAKR